MNYWAIIYRFAMALLIVLLVVGLIFVFLPPSHEIRQYHRKRVELTTENVRLEEQVRALKEKQDQFRNDPAFVERTAREAGMIKSNEFRFLLEAPPPKR